MAKRDRRTSVQGTWRAGVIKDSRGQVVPRVGLLEFGGVIDGANYVMEKLDETMRHTAQMIGERGETLSFAAIEKIYKDSKK